MKRLYIDVDGVLLGKDKPGDIKMVLARHATEFMELALANFDCYWLTTHCDGEAQQVIRYLRPYASREFLELIKPVKPTWFKTFKTEALRGNFYWIDDSPTATELLWLRDEGFNNRWINVNTSKHPDDLLRAMEVLKTVK